MVYLVYGNNRDKVLARSRELSDENMRANLGALYFKFTGDYFERAKLEELIGGQSLFSQKIVILCDSLLDNPEALDFVSKNIENIFLSKNIFIFRQGALDKARLEVFKKNQIASEEFLIENDARAIDAKEFNIFSFTDALGSRDRKLAWVIFHKALRAGVSAEELFWKIVWLFKSIILVSSINGNQGDLVSRLKTSPFVIKKSRGFLKNYPEESLIGNYRKLIDIYHKFRRSNVEAPMTVELFILNL